MTPPVPWKLLSVTEPSERLRIVAVILNEPPHGHRALESTCDLAAAVARGDGAWEIGVAWRAYIRERSSNIVAILLESL